MEPTRTPRNLTENQNNKNRIEVTKKQNKNQMKISSFHLKKNRKARD